MKTIFKKTLLATGIAAISMGAQADIVINQVVKGTNNTTFSVEIANTGTEDYETKTKLKLVRFVDGDETNTGGSNEKKISISNKTIPAGGTFVVYSGKADTFATALNIPANASLKAGNLQPADKSMLVLREDKTAAGQTTITILDKIDRPSIAGKYNIQRKVDTVFDETVGFNACDWVASHTVVADADGNPASTQVIDATTGEGAVNDAGEPVMTTTDLPAAEAGIGLGAFAFVEPGDLAYPNWNAECSAPAKPSVELLEGTAGVVSYEEQEDGINVGITFGANTVAGDEIAVTLTSTAADAVGQPITGNTIPADWNGTDVVTITIPSSEFSVSGDSAIVNYTLTASVGVGVASDPVAIGVNLTPPNVVSASITTVNNAPASMSETESITLSGANSTGEDITYAWTVEEANGLELTLAGADSDTLIVTAPVTSEDTEVTVKLTVTSGDETKEATQTLSVVNQAPIVAQDINIATVAGAGIQAGAGDYFSAADTAVLSLTLGNSVDGLIVNTDGSYSFNPDDAAYASMAKGDSQQLTTTVTAADQFGGSAVSTITIDIRGVVEQGEQENSDAGSFGALLSLLSLPLVWLRRKRK